MGRFNIDLHIPYFKTNTRYIKYISEYEGAICRTPNNELAYCLSLTNCPVLYQALSNGKDDSQKLFLRNSVCGIQATQWGMSNLVCCGSMSNYIKRLETPARKPTPKPESTNSSKDLTYLKRLLPSREVCGRSEDENRILGGSEARLGDYPWMAQLIYRLKESLKIIPDYSKCGGSLISKKYVITAAHCLVLRELQVYKVRLGEHDVSKEIDCYYEQGCNDKVQDVLVKKIIIHKGYRGKENSFHNDIALLRLIKNVDFTEYISPICLPIYGETAKTGQKVMIAGWGFLNNNGAKSKIKMKVKVTIWEQSDCFNIYKKKYNTKLFKKQICAGGEAEKDSCKGDSGGPLMTLIPRSPHWYLEGIVSFGPDKCGEEGMPGVYTKVSAYLDWISRNMKP